MATDLFLCKKQVILRISAFHLLYFIWAQDTSKYKENGYGNDVSLTIHIVISCIFLMMDIHGNINRIYGLIAT